jgi:serine-type D-Ala-D-Ala carboxypeptidase/endopeptidase (penicillin-binding protein 4)
MAARRRNPYPVLALAALAPAVLLWAGWRVADARRPIDMAPAADGTVPAPPLSTPLLSVRRAPGVLAADVNLAGFRTSAEPLMALIDDQSCVSISADGIPVAARNEAKPLRPASNVKVITAAVAAEVLGNEFRFTTTVAGSLGDDGVVDGDLYFVGGGDPLLTSAWWSDSGEFPAFNVTSLESLADAVVAKGVTMVTGNIVGDASRYDDEWYADTWAEADRFSNVGPISALLVNDSREAPDRSSNDPVIGAATVLRELLTARGVQVAGEAVAGSAGDAPSIAALQSAPLADVLAEMLTTSDNNTAEMLLKELGRAQKKSGSRAAGLEVVAETLRKWDVPIDGVELIDGSGISDENRLTCQALMSVLRRHRYDDLVGGGMATAGKAGGTLSTAFTEAPLEGVLRGKTGTLNNTDGVADKPGAKTLSGYFPLEGGGQIEFVLLLNGEQITTQTVYRPTWDALGAVLAAYPQSPNSGQLAPK